MIEHNYKKLQIWLRSMDLAEVIYKIVAKFPTEEKYGLSSQLRRCAVSVPSNISEGCGRGSIGQLKSFLEYSMGSCNEMQTQVELAFRFSYISLEERDNITDEAAQLYKMILSFYNKINT